MQLCATRGTAGSAEWEGSPGHKGERAAGLGQEPEPTAPSRPPSSPLNRRCLRASSMHAVAQIVGGCFSFDRAASPGKYPQKYGRSLSGDDHLLAVPCEQAPECTIRGDNTKKHHHRSSEISRKFQETAPGWPQRLVSQYRNTTRQVS